MTSIQEFLKGINTNDVVRRNIPMGRGMGFPMLKIVGERLLVSVFYYRSELHPEDKTLLMPPEYILTFDYPSGKLVSFENLRLHPQYSSVNFDKPLGTFRHQAIQHLNKTEYKEKKEQLYNVVNKLIAYLGGEGEFQEEDEKALADLYGMMTEPPLHPFYRVLSPQFYARYIEKKEDRHVPKE